MRAKGVGADFKDRIAVGYAEMERKKDEKIDGVIFDMSALQPQRGTGRIRRIFMKKREWRNTGLLSHMENPLKFITWKMGNMC